MAVPYVFGSIMGGSDIPLSELDDNFAYLTGSPTFDGNVTINGTLSVSLNTTINGNLGVGTSTPSQKLEVAGSAIFNGGVNAQGAIVNRDGASGGGVYGSQAGNTIVSAPTSGSVIFQPNGLESARITSAGNLGLGTSSPATKLDVYGGSNATFIKVGSASTSFASQINFYQGVGVNSFVGLTNDGYFDIYNSTGAAVNGIRISTDNVERMRIDNAGNMICNNAAIATNATDGFLYIPSCSGQPTGTPTSYPGRVPIVVDTTNNKLYFYSNGAWRDAGP